MTETPGHPTDALQDALDGRLDAAAAAAIEVHLSTCARCRRELDAMRWTKAQLLAAHSAVPAELDAHLRRALDDEDAQAAATGPARIARRTGGPWWWAAAAAALLNVVVWTGTVRQGRPAATADAVAAFEAFAAGRLTLDAAGGDPPAVEAELRSASLGFPIRVFDFGMMNYALAGGTVYDVAGGPSALMAYRGAGDLAVICQMYLGRTSDLPEPAARRAHNDIDFLVYRESGLTLVFWQEGDVVCVLVANGDEENAVQLAFAKAVKI